MNGQVPIINEKAAAEAFDRQAPIFDQLYGVDTIIRYKRKRVRDHVRQWSGPGARILELNAGTGEDAVSFAKEGYHVHATDISASMQTILASKVRKQNLEDKISYERCSFTQLETLKQLGPYDHVFSNFAGLNCTDQLDKVLDSFSFLVKAGGYATLVILPPFCLWEFMFLFKGKFKTALRRFGGKKGASAHIEGEYFRCWYYNPSFIRKHLQASFEQVSLEGLCTIVPPSYLENFAGKYPKLYRWLETKENRLKTSWPWTVIGDYYIITLRKKDL